LASNADQRFGLNREKAPKEICCLHAGQHGKRPDNESIRHVQNSIRYYNMNDQYMMNITNKAKSTKDSRQFKVLLKECSLARLNKMLQQIDAKIIDIQNQREQKANRVRNLYQHDDEVRLDYVGGRYNFTLDRVSENLADLGEQIADLKRKRKHISGVLQEKTLIERQAERLGGAHWVQFKDVFIALLIFICLAVLVVDTLNIGARGSGAQLRPIIEDGSLSAVEIVSSGSGYKGAFAAALSSRGGGGRNAEIALVVENGAVTETRVIDAGAGYEAIEFDIMPMLSERVSGWLWAIDSACCLVFLCNFFFELRLADSKRWYWKTHIIDFVTSIPLPPAQLVVALGFGGPDQFRAGRILRVVRMLRALRIVLIAWRGLDNLAEVFDVRLMKKTIIGAMTVLTIGGFLITMFGERGPNYQNVDGFTAGLWWSFATMVTGDVPGIYNPHTTSGRLLVVFLVVAGMVLVSVFTATLTSILVGKDERHREVLQNDLISHIKSEGEKTYEATERIMENQQDLGMRIKILEEHLGRSEDVT
jgi:hypothetical protein